jgi:hypothetical protein
MERPPDVEVILQKVVFKKDPRPKQSEPPYFVSSTGRDYEARPQFLDMNMTVQSLSRHWDLYRGEQPGYPTHPEQSLFFSSRTNPV